MTERYAIRLTKAAEKELYDLQAKQFKQVAKKIFSLQGNPMPQDCKSLQADGVTTSLEALRVADCGKLW